MRRCPVAVNGRREAGPHRPAAWIATLCLAAAVPLLASCGTREQRAERLYREAVAAVERGDYPTAADRFEKIEADFPGTRVAREAKGEAVLYRGLADAVRRFPSREAGSCVVRAARAVERYRAEKGSWPGGLGQLVPAYLAEEVRDPWGRALVYRLEPDGSGYVLSCLGADGAEGGTGADSDIVVRNGRFVRGSAEGPP